MFQSEQHFFYTLWILALHPINMVFPPLKLSEPSEFHQTKGGVYSIEATCCWNSCGSESRVALVILAGLKVSFSKTADTSDCSSLLLIIHKGSWSIECCPNVELGTRNKQTKKSPIGGGLIGHSCNTYLMIRHLSVLSLLRAKFWNKINLFVNVSTVTDSSGMDTTVISNFQSMSYRINSNKPVVRC